MHSVLLPDTRIQHRAACKLSGFDLLRQRHAEFMSKSTKVSPRRPNAATIPNSIPLRPRLPHVVIHNIAVARRQRESSFTFNDIEQRL